MALGHISSHKHTRAGIGEKELYATYKIFFGTMASEPRLRIINLLRKKEMNVSELVKELGADQASVSHDLARLKRCGFVLSERRGPFMYYSINKKSVGLIMDMIDKHMAHYCIHILHGLKNGKNSGNHGRTGRDGK